MNWLGLDLLKWLQAHRTPAADAFSLQMSEAVDGFWLLATLGVVFWVFGARWAYRAGLALAAGDLLTTWIKNAACVPRPWIRDPEILPVRAAQRGAFGYSLPSGHASSTAALWGGLAAAARRRWLWGVALAAIGLAGFSRVYLGVHTLADVLLAWLLAILVVWGAGRAYDWTEQHPARAWMIPVGLTVVAVAGSFLLQLRPAPAEAGPAFGRDAHRALAALLGFLAAWQVERRYIRFDPARLGAYRIVAVGVGVLVLSLMMGNLRRLLMPWLGEYGSLYVATAANPVWIFVGWPWLLRGLEKPGSR